MNSSEEKVKKELGWTIAMRTREDGKKFLRISGRTDRNPLEMLQEAYALAVRLQGEIDAAKEKIPNFTCERCGAKFCIKIPSFTTAEVFLEGVRYCTSCVEAEVIARKYDELQSQIDAGKQEWISVKDRLPEFPERLMWYDGKNRYGSSEPVLVLAADVRDLGAQAIYVAEAYCNHGKATGTWNLFGGDSTVREVTHWRKLPSPPAVSEEESTK